jgi:hypothetical protein
MKYLNLFEKLKEELWIVIVDYTDSPEDNAQFFYDDRESAENFIIVTLNDFIQFSANRIGRELKDDDIILTIEEAEEWFDNNWQLKLSYYKVHSNGTFELPEKYILAREARKYNL